MLDIRVSLKEARDLMAELWGHWPAKAMLTIIVFGILAWSVVQIDVLRERVPGIAAFVEKRWADLVGTRAVSVSVEFCGGQVRTINEGQVRTSNFPANYWLYSRTVRVESYGPKLFGVRFEARSPPEADLKAFNIIRPTGKRMPLDDVGQIMSGGIYVFVHKPGDFLKMIFVALKPELVDITSTFKCEEDVPR